MAAAWAMRVCLQRGASAPCGADAASQGWVLTAVPSLRSAVQPTRTLGRYES